jgi:hypothetical protein
LTIAYAAFQKSMQGKPRPPSVGGYTPEQRFFLAYAHNWATNMRPEYARFLAVQDPHPLPKFRTNGPLSNMPQFAQAFQCKAGDPMVRAEKDRCLVVTTEADAFSQQEGSDWFDRVKVATYLTDNGPAKTDFKGRRQRLNHFPAAGSPLQHEVRRRGDGPRIKVSTSERPGFCCRLGYINAEGRVVV